MIRDLAWAKLVPLEYTYAVCSQAQFSHPWNPGCAVAIHMCCLFTGTQPAPLGSKLQHWNACVLFVYRATSRLQHWNTCVAYSNNFKAATLEYMCVVVYRNTFRTFGVKVATQGCNTSVLFVYRTTTCHCSVKSSPLIYTCVCQSLATSQSYSSSSHLR